MYLIVSLIHCFWREIGGESWLSTLNDKSVAGFVGSITTDHSLEK